MKNFNEWLKKKMNGNGSTDGGAVPSDSGVESTPSPESPNDHEDHDHDDHHHHHFVGVFGWPWWYTGRSSTKKKKKECKYGKKADGKCKKK
jgi:hypothetical protein